MKNPYFVMIYNQQGECASPMYDYEIDEVKFFSSEKEAREAGNKQRFSAANGFEVFEMGNGED